MCVCVGKHVYACVHAHVIVCTHIENEHACVHACKFVQSQVLAMRVLRKACDADAVDISCLDARLYESNFSISLDKQEVYVLNEDKAIVGYVVCVKKMQIFGLSVWGCDQTFVVRVAPNSCCTMYLE